jgi:hypothetical protein
MAYGIAPARRYRSSCESLPCCRFCWSSGGALGGLIGALGVVANLAVARTRIPSVAKAPIMIGVGAVAFLVWLAVAAALT